VLKGEIKALAKIKKKEKFCRKTTTVEQGTEKRVFWGMGERERGREEERERGMEREREVM
jgi:hypothetical protein